MFPFKYCYILKLKEKKNELNFGQHHHGFQSAQSINNYSKNITKHKSINSTT